MRLEKLKITNITSLKGEHQIDFPRELAGEDLFAITGPTGSGKSSLLTAMTLALYGRGAKTELAAVDFITQGMREAKVELSFLTHGKTYLAVWSCIALNKKGEPLAQPRTKRELYQWVGHEDGQWQVLEKDPQEIIGLNYDQFSKTVVLNQGEFAKFLTSSFAERRQILEKLYQGEALSSLRVILNQRCKDQQAEIEQLELKKESILPFGQKEYLEDKQKIQRIGHDYQEQELLMEKLRELDADLKRMRELGQSLKRNRDKKVTHEAQHQEVNLKKIEKKKAQIQLDEQYQILSNDLKKERPLFQLAINCKKEEKQLKTLLSKYQEDQKKNELALQQKKEELALLTEQLKDEQTQLSQLTQKAPSAWQSLTQSQRQQLSQNLGQLLEQLYPLESAHYQLKAKIEHAQKELDEDKAKGLLKKDQFTQQHNDALLKKQTFEASILEHADQLSIEKLLLIQQNIQNALKQSKDLKERQEKLIQEQEQLNRQLLNQEQKAQLTQKQLELEEKNQEIFKLQMAVLTLQKANQDHDHCLACGEVNTGKHTPKITETENGQAQLDSARLVHQQEQAQLQKIKTLVEIKINESEALQQQKQEHQNLLHQLAQELKQPLSSSLEELLKHCAQALEQAKLIEKLQQQRQQEMEQATQQCQWLEKELEVLRVDFNQKSQQLKADLASLQNNHEQQIKLKEQLAAAEDNTQQIQNKKNILDQCIEAQQRILKDQQRKGALEQEQQQISEQQKALLPEIEKICLELTRTQTQLMETLTQLNLGAQNNHLEELLEEKEKARELLQKEKEKIDYEYQQLAQDENYHRTLLVSLDEQHQDIIQTSDNHKRKITETIGSNEKIKQEQTRLRWFQKIEGLSFEQYSEQSNLAFENFIIDQFIPFFESNEQLFKEHQIALSEAQARVTLYEKQKLLSEQLNEQCEKLKQTHLQYKNLQFLIGKDEFRNFALSMIENELVAHTNKELERICDGRYQIELRKSTRGQEYLIIDFWQGGSERKVSTLSGGETFLVSLAMALSLAEMCRGETQIDSFFIDEGFGTLDQDSLEEVIETLYTVRSRGKQIGIISHVKELTTRIAVNIDIQKDSHGQGQIQVLYN